MKPLLSILLLALWFTQPARAVPAPPAARGVAAPLDDWQAGIAEFRRLIGSDLPGYQEPVWASELRILLDVALRQRSSETADERWERYQRVDQDWEHLSDELSGSIGWE